MSKELKVIAGAPDSPLVIGDIEIPCYVLEDETRVLSQQGFLKAIGRAEKAKGGHGASRVDNPPSFLAANNLKPFISNELYGSTLPLRFQSVDGARGYGYPALLLPQVCEVYLQARDAGVLLASQKHIAARAEILIRGLAAVGIIALVDEATGYQRMREKRALAAILEKVVTKELQPWTKTFPFEFYSEICVLKQWPSIFAIKRPSVIGHYTNDIVYNRITPGLLEELRRVNPKIPGGYRKGKHHQWFTPEFGHPVLKEHIIGVMAIMRGSPNWNVFKRILYRSYPKNNVNLSMTFEEEFDEPVIKP